MKIRTLIAGYVLALALFLFAQHRPGSSAPNGFRSVVDLTHTIDSSASEAAGKSTFQVRTVANVEKRDSLIRSGSSLQRIGTRIVTPAGFAQGLWTLDQIPTERLIAPLVVLDVSASVRNQPDYQISVEDIAQWEQAHGPIPLGSVVMAHTGLESHGNSAKSYGKDYSGATHYPGYSTDAARFLVEGRTAVGLGIDTMSIDHVPSKDFAVRRYTLARSVYQLTNVANLDVVPAVGGMVVVAPTKLESGSSGPVRIMALLR